MSYPLAKVMACENEKQFEIVPANPNLGADAERWLYFHPAPLWILSSLSSVCSMPLWPSSAGRRSPRVRPFAVDHRPGAATSTGH